MKIQQYPGAKVSKGRRTGAIIIGFNTRAAAMLGNEVVAYYDNDSIYLRRPTIDDNSPSVLSVSRQISITVDNPENYLGNYTIDIDPDDSDQYVLSKL